jgi:hypothetical protein
MATARSTQFGARGGPFAQGSRLPRGGLASPSGEQTWSLGNLIASAISRAADLLPAVGPAVAALLLFA